MMTPEQALAGLAAITGGAGLSGIGVAFLGYLAAARAGRPAAEAPTIAIGGTEGPSAEAASIALASISAHLARLVAVLEIDAEQRFKGRDFRSSVDGREMLILQNEVRGHDER